MRAMMSPDRLATRAPQSPPCQRCGSREVAVLVVRTAGGAELASGEPLGRARATHYGTLSCRPTRPPCRRAAVLRSSPQVRAHLRTAGRTCLSHCSSRTLPRLDRFSYQPEGKEALR